MIGTWETAKTKSSAFNRIQTYLTATSLRHPLSSFTKMVAVVFRFSSKMEQEKKNRLQNLITLSVFFLFVRYMNVQLGLCYVFLFHAATEESTEASGEETTAALPGKTTDNMEEMKRLFLNFLEFFNVLFHLSVSRDYQGKRVNPPYGFSN